MVKHPLITTYAIKENNAKWPDVKKTQSLPSSLMFSEAIEVPDTFRDENNVD